MAEEDVPPQSSWPNDLPDQQTLRLVAASSASLVLYYRRWVHRRIEKVDFVDESMIRRRQSIDFTLPNIPIVPASDHMPERVYVPVAMFDKEVLRDFDLRDEAGCALPILTRRTSEAIDVMMLGLLAEEAAKATREVVDDAIRQELRTIVEAQPTAARAALERVRARIQSNEFDALAADLSRYFVLYVPLTSRFRERRILKMSWAEPLRGPGLSVRDRLRAEQLPFQLVLAGVGSAASYHMEITAPQDLMVTDAVVTSSDRQAFALSGGTRVLHLYLPNAPRGTLAIATFHFSLEPIGLLESASTIGVLTILLLWAGLLVHYLGWGSLTSEAAPAVLVSIPGVMAAFLIAPGQHPMAAVFAMRYQIAILGFAAISFLAAGSLAIRWDPAWLRSLTWWILFVGAWLIWQRVRRELYASRDSRLQGIEGA